MNPILNEFTDPRDEQTYRTIEINEKVWMAENLRYKEVTNSFVYGQGIPNSPISEYDYHQKYGRLYDWDSAEAACPSGWRLPTDGEWQDLISSFGGYYDRFLNQRIGEDLSGAFNTLIKGGESGFDVLLSGVLIGSEEKGYSYGALEKRGSFWSITQDNHVNNTAWHYYFDKNETITIKKKPRFRIFGKPKIETIVDGNTIVRALVPKEWGASCRCVKKSKYEMPKYDELMDLKKRMGF